VTEDPPIREDGRCAHCHGPRKMPKSKLHRDAAETDAFCSSTCCRAYHGLPVFAQTGRWAEREGSEAA
jgi:hypothetical protein